MNAWLWRKSSSYCILKAEQDLNWELGQKAALGNLEAVTSLVSQGADVCGFDGVSYFCHIKGAGDSVLTYAVLPT